jgi:phosphonate transport system substrate-binding protein
VLRIGLIPERDIFRQRRRYRPLAAYLSKRLGQPVELAMVNTYEAILLDFAEQKIGAAFLGSMVAALAMDRHDARVLAKPELPDGTATYYGVVFVKDGSSVQQFRDLAGRSIAMVRTTTAGNLFPCYLMMRQGLLSGPDAPRIVWVGTHDDVATEVMAGRADAGAIKNLRLETLLSRHSDWKVRRIAASEHVPSNALVLRKDLAEKLGPALTQALLGMTGDALGRDALKAMGTKRFISCSPEEYGPIYDMVQALGSDWRRIGVEGRPPRSPAERPRGRTPDPTDE